MNVKLSSHFSNQFMFLTARITGKTVSGTTCGTGFFYDLAEDERIRSMDHTLLVTNKHVVEGVVSGEFSIHLREDAEDGGPSGKSVVVAPPNFPKMWIDHPDPEVDLCAAPLADMFNECGIAKETGYALCLSRKHVASDDELALLPAIENVVMIGYPIGLWDDVNNLPLIRKGVTSTHPGIDYRGKPRGLLDLAVFPGSSGSPIMIYNDGAIMRAGDPSSEVRRRSLFLGVVFAQLRHSASGKIEYRTVPTKVEPVPVTHISAHLGVYIKARELKALENTVVSALGWKL